MKLKYVLIIFSSLLAIQCGGLKTQSKNDWAQLEQWDSNDDESLDVGEFVEGYGHANFFRRWEKKSKPISDSVFLHQAFSFLDRNQDNVLDSNEYNSRRILWSFRGMKKPGKWDRNHDKLLSRDEVVQAAQSENLVSDFDLTADGQITESEMAQGMFKVCDKNDDGKSCHWSFIIGRSTGDNKDSSHGSRLCTFETVETSLYIIYKEVFIGTKVNRSTGMGNGSV